MRYVLQLSIQLSKRVNYLVPRIFVVCHKSSSALATVRMSSFGATHDQCGLHTKQIDV